MEGKIFKIGSPACIKHLFVCYQPGLIVASLDLLLTHRSYVIFTDKKHTFLYVWVDSKTYNMDIFATFKHSIITF